MYQKEVKHTDLSFSNHHNLKCCHCFSHHKIIGVKGSRRDFWFLLPHLRTRARTPHTGTHRQSVLGGRMEAITDLPGPRQVSIQCVSESQAVLPRQLWCVSWLRPTAFTSLSLDDSVNHLYGPLVPACEGTQAWGVSSAWKGFTQVSLPSSSYVRTFLSSILNCYGKILSFE